MSNTNTTSTTTPPSSKPNFWSKIAKPFIRQSGTGYVNGAAQRATHDEVDGNGSWRLEHQTANQGTATKWLDVTVMRNWYERAASRKSARSVVNMFVCRPRKLRKNEQGKEFFDIEILERHPYTPQTFVPLGVSKSDSTTRYLVIVAPTRKATGREKADGFVKPYPTPEQRNKKKTLRQRLLGARPNPFTNDYVPSTNPPISGLPTSTRPKGPGGPDLDNMQAFIVRGDQAVTYGPGTWHAPMVVLGEKAIEFVVVQYANDVGIEDCQEVEIEGELAVDVNAGDDHDAAAPGIMRAKL